MAKTIKFNLILDEKPIRDIKGLQENFVIEDVLEFYQKGLLQKWLKVRGFDKYLKKVETIKKDEPVIIKLIEIFEIEKSEKEIKEAVYSLEFWKERKIELEEWTKKDTKIKQIIADYHNGYNVLLAKIKDNKEDMPFMKSAAKEINDKYKEIFKIDYPFFFANFKEDVPLINLAILMNHDLRKYYLTNQNIRKELINKHVKKSFGLLKGSKYEKIYKKNTNNIWKLVCNEPIIVTELSNNSNVGIDIERHNYISKVNAKNAIGKTFSKLYFNSFSPSDAVKYVKISSIPDSNKNIKEIKKFNGTTDGYWKDLEVAKTKVMVLSIPDGTFIRNANKPKEELSAKDVNGEFLILDGLLYKSNVDYEPISYMEV